MVSQRNEGIILDKTNFSFEYFGVLNPAFIEVEAISRLNTSNESLP